MKYTISKSEVDVIGTIWMPAATCAMSYTLDAYDVENARDEDGNVTRESVDRWVQLHTGDFQSIQDWRASLEVDGTTVDLDWADEESDLIYGDCMFPEMEDAY